MMQRMTAWYIGLTTRERILVSVAGALAALIVLIYGIVLPVGNALDKAAVRHREATERAGRIAAGIDVLKRAPQGRAAVASGPVEQIAAGSAQEAGFVVQSNQKRGADMAVLVIPTARPSAVLAWLDGLAGQGLAVEQVTMTPAPDGSVAVNVTLRKAGS
jgi:general secretion pathway protein M